MTWFIIFKASVSLNNCRPMCRGLTLPLAGGTPIDNDWPQIIDVIFTFIFRLRLQWCKIHVKMGISIAIIVTKSISLSNCRPMYRGLTLPSAGGTPLTMTGLKWLIRWFFFLNDRVFLTIYFFSFPILFIWYDSLMGALPDNSTLKKPKWIVEEFYYYYYFLSFFFLSFRFFKLSSPL